jgi:hypothetical protein
MDRLYRTVLGGCFGLCVGTFAGVAVSLAFTAMFPVPNLDEVEMLTDEVLVMMFSGENIHRFDLISPVLCALTGAWLGWNRRQKPIQLG